MWCSSCSRSGCSTTCWRTDLLVYSKGLKPLSIATVVALTTALARVFFYAPNDADQGFVQKIFYIHVPMAIVALGGFVAGGIMAIKHPASADAPAGTRPY